MVVPLLLLWYWVPWLPCDVHLLCWVRGLWAVSVSMVLGIKGNDSWTEIYYSKLSRVLFDS